MPPASRRRWLHGAALLAAYITTAKLGLSFDALAGVATTVWPPTGIALAALTLGGRALWPAVWIGAFAVNKHAGMPWVTALGMATGNTLEAVIGATLLARARVSPRLDRLRDVIALSATALASTPVSALAGASSLWLGGIRPPGSYREVAWVWWLGDVMGDLIVAPLVLTWLSRRGEPARPARRAEGVGLAAAMAAVVAMVFLAPRTLSPAGILHERYLLWPPLVWASLRFGPRGAATTTFLLSMSGAVGTALGYGPFVRATPHESLVWLHSFMAVLTVTTLILAAVVAERKSAAEAAHRGHALLTAIFEGTSDSIFVKDREGRYVMINTAGAAMLGRTPAEVVGRDDRDLFPSDEIRQFAEADRQIMATGEPRTVEAWVTTGTTRRALSAVKAPWRDASGAIVGIVGISRDITERKRAEDAIRAAEAEARLALSVREEFLAIASHELRTPLTALQLNLETALRRDNPAVDPRDRIARALRESNRLAGLIDSLLDVTRIRSGALDLSVEEVDLGEVARDLVRQEEAAAARAGCGLSMSIEAGVRGRWDRRRVEQIVANLLSNAIRYGRGRPIEVTVAGASSATATLSVRDHGIGIPPESAERIFDRFERAATPRGHGGLGLGLYIARQIAQAHGGTIRVASEPGAGATFTLELPRT